MWVYSRYLAPSLSTTDFSHALDTIAFDARGRYPTTIAGDFNAWAEEWGCPTSNISGRTLLNAFSTLDVVLLNEGTQDTFNWAGAGSIIDLTFVSYAAVKGYCQETLNAEEMSSCLADMHFFLQARTTLKNAILDSKRECLLKLCDAAKQDPWGGAYSELTEAAALQRTLNPLRRRKHTARNGAYVGDRGSNGAEVAEAGRSLQNNKAQGPDAVPNRAMKVALALRLGTFAELYNACLREGTFPRRWKVQNLLLLNKPGKPPGEASSYRPIRLLDTVDKVFQKLISKRLNLAIDAVGGLSPTQFGLRKGKSTLDAIRTVTGIAAEALRGKRWKGGTKKYCLLVTLDNKIAFNTANWTRIMQALRRQRIPEYLIRIVDSYLGERMLLFDTSDGPKEYMENNVRWSTEASHA
ncbi:uncharacterized protein [Drosophila suzukii]|uniref:Reverse transcriptase domain-containing protein n=1 Tax=Drosophila suzukii TaxID=28584 RepID=A0ABM4TW26_DROSZ